MKPIDFKTSNYFTGMLYVAGILILSGGLFSLIAGKYLLSSIACIVSLAILTTHYRLLVDLGSKRYAEYISFFGMKVSAERGNFETIQYVFIKKTRVSQQLNSRVQSTTIHKWQFDGYLKFSEDNKVHLMTLENKSVLLKRLNVIAGKLNTTVVDYSKDTELKPG